MTKYSQEEELVMRVVSLTGRTILRARIVEDESKAVIQLFLDDGRKIEIGASGNLYDEAYLVFQKI